MLPSRRPHILYLVYIVEQCQKWGVGGEHVGYIVGWGGGGKCHCGDVVVEGHVGGSGG